jgi:hypothetical protein
MTPTTEPPVEVRGDGHVEVAVPYGMSIGLRRWLDELLDRSDAGERTEEVTP